MSDWAALNDREQRILAEVEKTQGLGTCAVLGQRLGVPWQAVAYDLGYLRMIGLVRRDQVGKLITFDTTPKGQEVLVDGAAETVEVAGDVL